MAKKQNAALVLRFLKGSKFLFLLGVLCAAVTALADMIIPQIVKITVDNVIRLSGAGLSEYVLHLIDRLGGFEYLRQNLWIMALSIILVAAVKVASQYGFRVFNTKASETLLKTARDHLFTHIEHLPYSWHMKNRTGDIIQRCTSDIETMRKFISEQMTSMFRILILLIFSLVFMFRMNPLLALIAFVPMPLIILKAWLFYSSAEPEFMKLDEKEGVLSSMVQENLTGVRVVRAFGRENYERERFHSHNGDYTDHFAKISIKMCRFWATSDILSGIQVMLVVVVGAVFCIQGKMTAGSYLAFITYNSLLVWPVRSLGRIITEMSRTRVSIARIAYIMDAEAEQDALDAQTPDLSGDIVFDHVTFAYDNCPPVLKDVSFTMPRGTTLGILGGTGSGKSTMMLLLDKLYDLPQDCGKISIGGVDLRHIKTSYLRKNIGIVLQDPYLFSRTIEENIRIADDSLSHEQVREAARAACLDEAISSFAKGYETFVGERGVTLSGGQKQRAAIARTLVRKTPILIFDDSLSAVDTETDAKIRASLEARFGTASVILISHRITTLSKADHILVLDKGQITEQGSHDELIAKNGIYRRIYDIQTGLQEVAE